MHTQPAQGCQAAVVEWQGLYTWRESKVDNRLVWGDTDAQEPQQLKPRDNVDALLTPQLIPEEQLPPLADSLLETGMQVLSTASPAAKAALTQRAWRTYCAGGLPLHSPQQHPGVPYTMPDAPARPSKPKLVSTREVGLFTGLGQWKAANTMHIACTVTTMLWKHFKLTFCSCLKHEQQ